MCQIEPIEVYEYQGCTINISPEEYPINPLEDCDTLSTMLCSHPKYRLGHEKIGGDVDFLEHLLTDGEIEKVLNQEETEDWEQSGVRVLRDYYPEAMRKLWDVAHDVAIILPLWLYDHSGLSIAAGNGNPFHCPWDSGQVGYVYVTKENARSEYGWERISKKRREFLVKIILGEVRTYRQYLTGQVYGFVAKDENGKVIDSCMGFYGYGDWAGNGLLEEAEMQIDCYLREVPV